MQEPAKRDASANIAALVHLYRGEVARGDSWRARLDNTTNWALTTTAAVVSFGLGSAGASHAVFLAGIYLVINFLLIEAGRYRKWDVYLRRVRLLETGVFVPLLRDEAPDPMDLRELGQMLDAPRLEVPFWVALAQRIRRAYGAVLGILLIAWVVKLTVFVRTPLRGVDDFLQRAHVGFLPGGAVLVLVVVVYLLLGLVTAMSFWTRPPATELRPRRRKRSLREAFEGAASQISRPLSP